MKKINYKIVALDEQLKQRYNLELEKKQFDNDMNEEYKKDNNSEIYLDYKRRLELGEINKCCLNCNNAGFDLYVPKTIEVPGKAISFKIGLKVKISAYIDGMLSSYKIYPRSSMGANTPLRLCNSIGLVDCEYTGELYIFVDNMSDDEYIVKMNERLVQLVGPNNEMFDYELVDQLEETNRGENGIGSSGK